MPQTLNPTRVPALLLAGPGAAPAPLAVAPVHAGLQPVKTQGDTQQGVYDTLPDSPIGKNAGARMHCRAPLRRPCTHRLRKI